MLMNLGGIKVGITISITVGTMLETSLVLLIENSTFY